jgi:hypothetical protein
MRGSIVVGEEAIAFADEQVADVQGHRNAVFGVQRGFAVAFGVAVLDVIVNERGLVEDLDGDGGLFDGIRDRAFRIFTQRLIGGDGEEGTPAFAGAGEPLARDVVAVAA